MKQEAYTIVGQQKVSPELKRLCARRVRPFLDVAGMSTRTLEHLMCEAYWQGIKDAAEAMGPLPEPPTSSV
jgi:hypothetical protein